MNYPHVQFKLNKKLDEWTGKEFGIGSPSKVSSFYAKYQKDIVAFRNDTQIEWGEVSKYFFELTKNIFSGCRWPEGKYLGYVSVFNCNPRFLSDKTFQVFYKHSAGPVYVTAHEMLHFIFYKYAIENHSNLFKNKDTENGIFWDVAEICNVVLLHDESFVKVHGVKKIICYPEHKKYISKLRKKWEINKDIDQLIISIYEATQK